MSTVALPTDRQPTDTGVNGVMTALVYHGPGRRAWETTPKPTIREHGDAIVRITTSTICGTDLHILKGDVPSVAPGRILGHTHRFCLDDIMQAYDTFADAARTSALKVILKGSGASEKTGPVSLPRDRYERHHS